MSKSALQIKVTEQEGIVTVLLSGPVDAAGSEQVKAKVLPLCDRPQPKVLLDCRGMSYINSLSMGQLTTYHRTCEKNGGRFVVYGLDDKILEIMKLIHLDDLVTIAGSRDEAIASLG